MSAPKYALLQCTIERLTVDFARREITMHFPAGECCDMRGAVLVALDIFKDVNVIRTFSGTRPDTQYLRVIPEVAARNPIEEWEALMAPRGESEEVAA